MSWKTECWKSLPWNRVKKKRMIRNEDSLKDIWDNIKQTNITRFPEGEDVERGLEKIFEDLIAEKFPNMGKEAVSHV